MATKKVALVPAAKMTKTQIIKAMAEKLEADPKQIQSFFDALAEMADRADTRGRRVHRARPGQAGESGAQGAYGPQPCDR